MPGVSFLVLIYTFAMKMGYSTSGWWLLFTQIDPWKVILESYLYNLKLKKIKKDCICCWCHDKSLVIPLLCSFEMFLNFLLREIFPSEGLDVYCRPVTLTLTKHYPTKLNLPGLDLVCQTLAVMAFSGGLPWPHVCVKTSSWGHTRSVARPPSCPTARTCLCPAAQ